MTPVPTSHPTERLALPLAALAAAGLAALTAAGRMPDGLSLAIAGLTLFVGGIVVAFSHRYMRTDRRRAGFHLRVALLVASVLLFVLTGNVLVMAAGWLASGWLLAGLIGHGGDWAEARAAARRARLSFLAGDGALIVALAILCGHAGSLDLDTVVAAAATLPKGGALAAALLLLAAAAARCALPPFAGWLLSSMTAPTPVSALMHAGLVNAGGFLLIRFAPLFENAPEARIAAVLIGLFAAIHGIGIMAVRPDIKRSLAGSTVSQMGFMIMSCGLGAYAAALWHIVAHGLFKAWLFLGSGSAVGMKAAKAPALPGRWTPAIIAATTLAAGVALVATGEGGANLVPLLLAIATGATVLLASLRPALPAKARLSAMLLLAALVGAHGLGYLAMQAIVRPDAPAALPAAAPLVLLAAFLASWVWQQRVRTLPPALYVRLLNAGSLKPATQGDA